MKYLRTFENHKKDITEGDWVRLIHMDDMNGVPDGTYGQIYYIDDIGNIIVKWENGSSLALIPDIDEFEIISEDEIKKYKEIKRFKI